eukprot:Rmarinus@m.17968
MAENAAKMSVLMNMGFSSEDSAAALLKHNNNAEEAIDDLLSNQIEPAPELTTKNVFTQNEDDDMTRAIQESLKDQENQIDLTGDGPVELKTGFSEDDISKAVELSLRNQEAEKFFLRTTPDPINPYDRKREKDMPVGLKNVGNTCYVNSLLQTYFFIPQFRECVISAKTHPPAHLFTTDEKSQPGVPLLRELQTLFANLSSSPRKYCDPTKVVIELMRGVSGEFAKYGAQQDASEFNGLFFDKLEAEAKTAGTWHPSNSSAPLSTEVSCDDCSVLRYLFEGTFEEEFHIACPGKGPVETGAHIASQASEFRELILQVGETTEGLYQSIDGFMESKIPEFKKDDGEVTSALRRLWIKELPPVLSLHLQRTRFDRKTNTSTKTNTPLFFDREIYLDRYLKENAAEVLLLREKRTSLASERATLESQLKTLTQYGEEKLPLDGALRVVRDALAARATQSSASVSADILPHLEGWLAAEHQHVSSEMKRLDAEITALQAAESQIFDGMRSVRYRLHAVLVHDGVATSGHYWAFLLSSDGQWYRFNDIQVTKVDEETVFRESRGGYQQCSAYRLIYIDDSKVKGMRIEDHSLPYELEQLVKRDADVFLDECRRWDKRRVPNEIAENVREVEKSVAVTTKEARDGRLLGFDSFLFVLDHHILLAKIADAQFSERKEPKATHDEVMSIVFSLLSIPKTPVDVLTIELGKVRTVYSDFILCSEYVIAAMRLFLTEHFHDASLMYLKAHNSMDYSVRRKAARRDAEILVDLGACLVEYGRAATVTNDKPNTVVEACQFSFRIASATHSEDLAKLVYQFWDNVAKSFNSENLNRILADVERRRHMGQPPFFPSPDVNRDASAEGCATRSAAYEELRNSLNTQFHETLSEVAGLLGVTASDVVPSHHLPSPKPLQNKHITM